jgi:vancomycin resistance protein YoaR
LKASLDRDQLFTWLDQVDKDLGLPPHDAYLVVEGTEVTIEPEVDGTIVDRAKAEEMILTTVRSLTPAQGELPVIELNSKVHSGDLGQAKAEVEQALSRSVTLKFNKQRFKLEPDQLGQFVVQQVDPDLRGAEAVTVTLDQEALARWLSETIAPQVDRKPVDAVVGWNDELIAIEESVDGVKLKPSSLAAEVTESFFSNHNSVDIPVATIKPAVDSNNLGALGITTRLGVGDSNFSGSDAGRETNIVVGANLLNGTLVPPHGEYSFNHSIGVITEEAGFVESAVIDGERIGRDIGGGICQVSTTMFRAALMSGMPITEWWPHRYRLGFYELDGWTPGLDASILQPEGDPFSGGDFKFRNPSDSWLLIESYTQGTQVVIVIYGPDLGYDVQISEPHVLETIPAGNDLEIVDDKLGPGTVMQTELALEGQVVSYTREVRNGKGEVVLNDEWTTRFEPRGNVYKVSPDMRGKSAASGGS